MKKTAGADGADAPGKRRRNRVIAVIEVLFLLAFLFSMRFMLPFMAFRPTRDITKTPGAYGMAFEDVTLTTSDGVAINGWFVPAPNERGTLLFFHGNAGNISGRLDSIEIFRDLGLSVFIIDYRGYGKSGGRRSVPGVTLDALAAWDYLTEKRGVSPDEIVVFGRSIGGAVAMELMRHVKPRALILESTFSSLPEMIRVQFLAPFARLVIGDVWNSAEAASALTVPALCVHSPDDGIVPYRLGRRLYEAVASEKTFVQIHGGHNEGFLESIDIY
ncbi:MAG: lysophospholipase, partial [Synergistaceae bacterium]|nr:lysophospholipase [Synergistaceae bacterium]